MNFNHILDPQKKQDMAMSVPIFINETADPFKENFPESNF